jgi:hypothetical protein
MDRRQGSAERIAQTVTCAGKQNVSSLLAVVEIDTKESTIVQRIYS